VVDVVEPIGHEVIVHGRIGSDAGTQVVARLDARDEPRPGDALELTFEPGDLHLFDPVSRERLRS
jgi:ABC-type sugar transport system ATPase subunit